LPEERANFNYRKEFEFKPISQCYATGSPWHT
jgi:hypothetical protein